MENCTLSRLSTSPSMFDVVMASLLISSTRSCLCSCSLKCLTDSYDDTRAEQELFLGA